MTDVPGARGRRNTPQLESREQKPATTGTPSATRLALKPYVFPTTLEPARRDGTYVAPPVNRALLLVTPSTTQRTPLPPGSTEFRTAAGSVIADTPLASHDPATTTQRVLPSDPALARYLTSIDAMFPLNRERTDNGALRRELETWAGEHPDLVAKAVGLAKPPTSERARALLRTLSPAQAARLTTMFASSCLDFLQGQPAGPAKAIDSVGVHTLVAGGRGTGVCRNYAETVTTTFAVLKGMQNTPSRLVNTYAQQISGFGHRWNAFYTVEPDRRVVATMTDGVWADNNQLEVNTRGRVYAMQQWLMSQLDTKGDDQSGLVSRAMAPDYRSIAGVRFSGSGTITADEVREAGGIQRLAASFRTLWLPQQAEFLNNLAADVRASLLAHLKASGDPTPYSAKPDQQAILYTP